MSMVPEHRWLGSIDWPEPSNLIRFRRTLRDLIATMGGELHITATLPDCLVKIGNSSLGRRVRAGSQAA